MPSTSLVMPSQANIRSATTVPSHLTVITRFFSKPLVHFLLVVRSPSTPDLSTEELPDDINDMADIPNDLELNQEDFSDVLPRLPDDLQDFDLFEGFLKANFSMMVTHKETCHNLCMLLIVSFSFR